MKTEEECLDNLRKWFQGDIIGNILFYRAPNSAGAECIIERTIKAREMEPTTRAAFEMLMDDLDIERGQIIRNKDGKPDRVTLTRRFDIDG